MQPMITNVSMTKRQADVFENDLISSMEIVFNSCLKAKMRPPTVIRTSRLIMPIIDLAMHEQQVIFKNEMNC